MYTDGTKSLPLEGMVVRSTGWGGTMEFGTYLCIPESWWN